MAQIKVLKINSDGFQEEHGASDEATFATVTGTTQVAVTNGVTIGNNITFNAVTDTIAGIQNQNLLDKSANESIAADWTITTGHNLTLIDAPTATTDVVNKAYVDSLVSGADWQSSVLDRYDPTTALPAGPTTGDRYISTATANGWTENNIYEYNGASWDEIAISEGMAAWVEDENRIYIYNGTSWVVMSAVYSHNDLSGLQGGETGSYYHLTGSENTWLDNAITAVSTGTNLVDKSAAESITGTWSFSRIDTNSGELRLPSAASASPVEGDSYWDATADILYVYNGSSWQNVNSAGSSSYVSNEYTAGAGGIAQYDAVYISAADTVLKADASSSTSAHIIGFAPSAITAAADGAIQENGILAGVLSGATAGDSYYLQTTAGIIGTSIPTGTGNNVVRVGFAKNATDLQIAIQFVGIRS